jgi:hypothetical protein
MGVRYIKCVKTLNILTLGVLMMSDLYLQHLIFKLIMLFYLF